MNVLGLFAGLNCWVGKNRVKWYRPGLGLDHSAENLDDDDTAEREGVGFSGIVFFPTVGRECSGPVVQWREWMLLLL